MSKGIKLVFIGVFFLIAYIAISTQAFGALETLLCAGKLVQQGGYAVIRFVELLPGKLTIPLGIESM